MAKKILFLVVLLLDGALAARLVLPLERSLPIPPSSVQVQPGSLPLDGRVFVPEEALFSGVKDAARLNFGNRTSPTLMRILLEVPEDGRWWLVSELRTPKSLEIRVGGRFLGTFGDSLPFSERPTGSTDLAVPLDLRKGAETLFVRVAEFRGPCEVKLRLSPDLVFPGEIASKTFLDAWILGYLTAVFLVAVYLWYVVREASYGWYVAYYGLAILWLATKRGIGFRFLWPDIPWLNAGVSVAMAHLALGALAMFVTGILRLSQVAPRQAAFLKAMAIVQLAVSPFLLGTWISGTPFLLVESIQLILPVSILVILVGRAGPGKDPLARRLLLAILPLGLAMVFGALVEFGFWPGGAAVKASVLTAASLLENTLATLVLVNELRRRESARLSLERSFHSRLTEQNDLLAREISQDLHDGVGQQAYALRMKVFAWKDRIPEEFADSLDERIEELHGDLRTVSHRLFPPRLHEKGALRSFQELCEHASTEGFLPVAWKVDPDVPELSDRTAIHLYRIAQEAIANAQRHSNATRVDVALWREGKSFVLEIVDDGIGLPDSNVGQGLGLSGMRSRALSLGGTLSIGADRSGRGCRVTVKVPIAEMTAEAIP